MTSKLILISQSPYSGYYFDLTLWISSHLASKFKPANMKLKLTLLSFCLFGIGLFSHAQADKSMPAKAKFKAPLHAEKQYDKDGNLIPPPPPPPKIDIKHFKAPKGAPRDKDRNLLPPPPPSIARDDNTPPPPPRAMDKNDVPPPPPPAIDRKNKGLKAKGPKAGTRLAPPRAIKDNLDPALPPPADARG
jgi:hypothetical protein